MADGHPEKQAPGAPAPRRALGRADQPDRVRAHPGAAPARRVPRADADVVIPPALHVPAASSRPAPRPRDAPAGAPEATPAPVAPEVARERPPSALAVPAGAEGLPASAARELARAFQASAEALQGIHRLHGELAQSMRRADRSEMVLQSTTALNETFRTLATVQKRLLDRLEAPPPPVQRMLPLMVIGLLVVFVGGIVAVVHVVDRLREERVDPAAYHEQMEASRRRGAEEASAASASEVARSRREAEELQGRLAASQARTDERVRALEEAQGELRALEVQREELAGEALRLRGEGAARKAVEDELRVTTQKLALLEPRLRQLEADLAAERAEKQRLQGLVADVRAGLAPPLPAEEPDAPATSEPVPPGLAVSRDARQLEAIRTTVNRFLETDRGRGTEYWQLSRVTGVSADRLHDVVALRYDAHGKLLDSVEARELVIRVDRAKRVVEFEFREGSLVFDGTKTPFRGGTLPKIVAEGDDAVRLWLNSGLLILRTR